MLEMIISLIFSTIEGGDDKIIILSNITGQPFRTNEWTIIKEFLTDLATSICIIFLSSLYVNSHTFRHL